MGIIGDIKATRRPIAGFAVIGIAWAVFFAQMPVIKAAIGASDGTYGAVVLLVSFGALAAMWLAPLAHRIGGPLALPIGALLVAVGMSGAAFSTHLWVFAAAMLLASAGSGVVDVLVNARVSAIEARTGRSLMNLNHALYSFSYAGGALMTGFLREAGLSPGQISLLLFVVLIGLGAACFGGDPAAPEEGLPDKAGIPMGVVTLGGIVVMMAFLCEAASEGWSALHLERTLGAGAAEGAMGPAILGLTMGIGRLFGHALSRHMRDTLLMALACSLAAIGVAIAGAAGSIGVAYAGFAIAGTGISVVAPLALALVGRVVPPAARLAAISRASVLGYGAFFFGPPLMGLVSEGFGLRVSFYTVAVLLAVTAFTIVPALARKVGSAA